jgi:hypothetical protein
LDCIRKRTKLVNFTVGKKINNFLLFWSKKEQILLKEKTHSKILNLESEISHLFQEVILFVGQLQHFAIKKSQATWSRKHFGKFSRTILIF